MIYSERIDGSSLGKEERDLLKQLLRNSEHLQEKIFRIEEEMENRKRQCTVKVKVNHLHPEAHLLQAVHAVEENEKQATSYIAVNMESLG